jgi:hypothetical protein
MVAVSPLPRRGRLPPPPPPPPPPPSARSFLPRGPRGSPRGARSRPSAPTAGSRRDPSPPRRCATSRTPAAPPPPPRPAGRAPLPATPPSERNGSRSPSASISRMAARSVSRRRSRRSSGGGDAPVLHPLPRHPLDAAQVEALARLHQGDGRPLAPGASRAPDAVHVHVRRLRDVVVHHVAHVLHVQPARRHVGGDQQVRRPLAEARHHPVALRLRQAAVQRLRPVAAHPQRLRQLVHLHAGAAEHDRRDGLLQVQDAPQRLQLVRRGTR